MHSKAIKKKYKRTHISIDQILKKNAILDFKSIRDFSSISLKGIDTNDDNYIIIDINNNDNNNY